jgi:hypothetical protein
MGALEEGAKTASSAITAMQSTPLAIALLMVNVAFLGFTGYIMREVSANASERNKLQMEMITNLVSDVRHCRSGQPTDFKVQQQGSEPCPAL